MLRTLNMSGNINADTPHRNKPSFQTVSDDTIYPKSENLSEHFRCKPVFGAGTRIAKQAVLYGHVLLGERCSVWSYAVLRGDLNKILIGNETNLQEHACVHVSPDFDVRIGDRVTVGHGAVLHGCHIASDCLIGMHATILDGAVIGDHCIIGAHALVTQHKEIPPYSLVLGVPREVVRALTETDLELIASSAQVYVDGLKDFPF